VPRGRTLRVIAGSARGRRLAAPSGDDVRPTQDRVREAVFSALDARGFIDGASVLDLYAGTGALAIEALSRGAARAVLVERDPRALAVIRANLDTTTFAGKARVEVRDVATFVASRPPREAPFDLVLSDPPYDTADDAVHDVLHAMAQPSWLAPDGLVVVERPQRSNAPVPSGLRCTWERVFGDTLVTFLQPDVHA
jgi:16S rRNA (guanine966-N2)-methyltransferase